MLDRIDGRAHVAAAVLERFVTLPGRAALRPSRSGWRRSARRRASGDGRCTSMSRRDRSISSSSTTVTLLGAQASSIGPSAVSIDAPGSLARRQRDHRVADANRRSRWCRRSRGSVAPAGSRAAPGSAGPRGCGRRSMPLEGLEQGRPAYQGVCVPRSTTLSPRSADRHAPDVGDAELARVGRTRWRSPRTAGSSRPGPSCRPHATRCGMPSNAAMWAWRRVWTRTPIRASTRITATFAVDAPVAMLRVYCSWPGVSAMMNLRFAVRSSGRRRRS